MSPTCRLRKLESRGSNHFIHPYLSDGFVSLLLSHKKKERLDGEHRRGRADYDKYLSGLRESKAYERSIRESFPVDAVCAKADFILFGPMKFDRAN